MKGALVKRASDINRRPFPFELLHATGPANNMGSFHWHDFMEISYVTRGTGRYEIEGKVFPVRAGDIVIINNVERHRVTYDPVNPLFETVIHFAPRLIWSPDKGSFDHRYLTLFDYEGASFSNIPRLAEGTRKAVARLVADMKREYLERPPGYELMIKAKLLAVIAHLIRESGVREEPDAEGGAARRRDIARLERILSFIQEHAAGRLGLADVSARFSMNPSYFSDYFHRNLGIRFSEHLAQIRVQEAVRLLNEGRMSSMEIALACGFGTAASYYRAFRRVTSMNPGEYLGRGQPAERPRARALRLR